MSQNPTPPSDAPTPRSNAASVAWETGEGNGPSVSLEFARKLERELAERFSTAEIEAVCEDNIVRKMMLRRGAIDAELETFKSNE